MIEYLRMLLNDMTPTWMVLLIAMVGAVLPLGAEVMLTTIAALRPALLWPVVVFAAMGQCVSCAVLFGLAYTARKKLAPGKNVRFLAFVSKHGAPSMALSGLPVVGDIILLIGGALHLPLLASALWCALGILIRLLSFAGLVGAIF